MAGFFIERPIFAWVIAIVVMLAGALAIPTLPVSQYPEIAPPSVNISASYPGASARTLEDTVTQVIEQNMKALDGLLYMSSTSDSSGNALVTLTFTPGTDVNIAQVQAQNKLQLATPLLPREVQQQGLRVTKATANILLVVAFYSEDGSMAELQIADYMVSNILDSVSRVKGVGDIRILGGAQAAMRIWLDPAKLYSFSLTPADVRAAIEAQNAQVSAGQLGGTPAIPGQPISATISSQSRLQTPGQFGAILLRVNTDGSTLRLRDVARIELGSESYNLRSRFNGKPAAGLGIMQQSGANALETAAAVRAHLAELEAHFPPGLHVAIPHDTTPVVKESIHGVVITLLEAIGLVFLVMLLFLQNFRATLIPTLAVPVVLLGTFAVLAAFGFGINTLTMFAMVLAIGLLVDDAIVVVENVERVMREEGLPAREATHKAMGQISGALVGIALVLSAVFVPMAFFGGSTGLIYRQFSITIVSAMVLSVLVALIFTPALCATLLRPHAGGEAARGPFGWFNRAFAAATEGYTRTVAAWLRRGLRYLVLYALLLAALAVLFLRLPTAFLPDEDSGFIITMAQLPPGATLERTQKTMEQISRHYLENEDGLVTKVFATSGFSFAGSGQNAGQAFVELRPWDERTEPSQGVQALAERARQALRSLPDGIAFPLVPPPVRELGNATGFTLYLQDRGGLGHATLMDARNRLLALAAQHPQLRGVRPNGLEDTPQLQLDIDHDKASALGLSIAGINDVLSTAWGGRYVNDFIDRGRVKKVYVQGEAGARMQPEDLDKWYARNDKGQMVPFVGIRLRALDLRLAATHALQRHSRRGDPGPVGAGSQHRAGHAGDCRHHRRAAARHRLRVDRRLAAGAAIGRPGAAALRAVAARGVPVPRRALRELVDSVRDHARGAARGARRRARRNARRQGQRHLFPGRAADHDRPVGEERDPDRGVRQGPPGARRGPARGHAGSVPPAAAPDPHDLAGLRLRRAAARHRQRRRFRCAERDRHGCGRRHDLGHRARDLLRAAVLRAGATPLRHAHVGSASAEHCAAEAGPVCCVRIQPGIGCSRDAAPRPATARRASSSFSRERAVAMLRSFT